MVDSYTIEQKSLDYISNGTEIFYDVKTDTKYSGAFLYHEAYKHAPLRTSYSNGYTIIKLGPYKFMFPIGKNLYYDIFLQIYNKSVKDFDHKDDYFD